MAQYTKGNHAEIPDQTPVEMPVGYHPPETLEALIARLVRVESVKAGAAGQETFEEADDFDVDDDAEIVSPYQMTTMQEEYVHARPEREAGKKRSADGGPADQHGNPPAKGKGAETTEESEAESDSEPVEKASKKAAAKAPRREA